MDNSHKNMQSKKLYEVVLTTGVEPELKREAVLSIIRMALTDHSHFSFLLTQVNWFCESNLSLIPLLAKVLRAYRGTSKTATKVVYNLLAEGLSIDNVSTIVVDILADILCNNQDNATVIDCLRENYPHKVCPVEAHIAYVQSLLQLSMKAPSQRFDLLEIIIQNLASFDTEMTLGEKYASKLICFDQDVLALQQECGALEHKYDEILSRVIKFISEFDQKGKDILLKQVFLIFEKVILAVDNTKMIQSLVFYLAQTSAQHSSSFLTLLMLTIFQNYSNKASKRKFIAALQYLRSYLNKSFIVEEKRIKKIFNSLITHLKQNIQQLEDIQFENMNLNQFGEQNTFNLYVLETILYIKWKFGYVTRNQNARNQYNKLIELANVKLCYSIFIDPTLLSIIEEENSSKNMKTNIIGNKIEGFKTKCVEKFLPIFLPKTRKLISMKENLSMKRKRPNWSMEQSTQYLSGQQSCKKLYSVLSTIGNLTPIHYEGLEI